MIETPAGDVSGILDIPAQPIAALTLAHGAGAGMTHKFMSDVADSLTAQKIAVLRFQFPYMEAGSKRPDRPPLATATVAAAVKALRARMPGLPIFAAGKSFGARMSTTAAAEGMLEGIKGIICFGFPLHPPEKASTTRAKHLAEVQVPMLFLQGTRDKLADLKLMRGVCAKLSRASLHIVEGADHGFDVLKRSGRSNEDVLQELARESLKFCQRES